MADHAESGVLHGLLLSRSGLDRAADRRNDGAWLAGAWADRRTRVLAVSDGRVLAELPAAAQDAVQDGSGDGARLLLLEPAAAPAGDRYFLGVDAAGTAYFAVGAADLALEGLPSGSDYVEAGLREVGGLLDAVQTGLVVHAVGVDNWHRTHTHCPRCGTPTTVESGGHTRRCPEDGSEHYPRTDPAVIMSVVDDDDRILLGRQARWPARRFSTLAGFVEPGESLEQAVAREVLEETGVVVSGSTYLGSQPWPFPASLMLGFAARASSTQITTDDEEIEEAHWWGREELGELVGSGEVLLPPPISIARRLIEHWYGASLGDAGGVWR